MAASTAVVNVGRALITNRINGGGTTPTYVAIGTGSTAVSLTDTTLGTEVETRSNGTASRTTTSTTNDTFQVVSSAIVATAPRVVAEVGLFDASSSGTLFVRGVLGSTVSLATGDSITVTVTVQVTSSVI